MKVKNGFEMQNVCGEHIIVPAGIENVDYSKIISMNPTAAYLWEKVAAMDEFTIDEMVQLLLDEYEVTEDVIDGPRSVIFDEAENRLHAQKAVLAAVMGGI